MERWEEEMELVTREMEWTVNCFEYCGNLWEKRAEKAESPGKVAYAWKECAMWRRWAGIARGAFEDVQCE